ncbi:MULTISPECIES: hypothetical protein [unclassified Serratia (in: enterobacteria)]|uniref:hypothetical protein n=1 Tax=unclassified Serratia (in: enterobacteria) TaxID=2647522 RepID=UPI0030761908
MTKMAFWSKSSGVNGWRKAHFVDGAWHTTACATSKTLEALNAHGDHWELVTVEEAQERFTQVNYLPVSEITETRFNDMLEVLPPLDWWGGEHSQSFKLMEMYSGNITDIFARFGTRYFQMRNIVTLTHAQIIEKVRAFIDAERIAA